MFCSIYVNLSGSNADTHYIAVPYKARVEALYFTSDGSHSKHAANYFTITVKDHSGDAIGSLNTSSASGVDLTGGAPASMSVDGQYADIAAAEALQFDVAKAGSGMDCIGTVTVQLAAARG